MPVDFLPDERAQAYGRYAGEPSDVDLARVFYLDDADCAFIAAHRGDHNRLGVALQLTTLRYLGTFLADPGEAPPGVVATLAAQLGLADGSGLARYRVSDARWDHAAEIRRRYGYRDFHDQPDHALFVRWLYARAWAGAERPSALFDLAVARLIAQKVVLPGLTTLTRLVARVRDRANARLWRRLAALPSADQRAALERLLLVGDDGADADAGRQTPLDRLRRGPVQATAPALVAALKRLDEVRALGVGALDLTGLPPGRLRALARYATVSRAQAVSQMAPDRRVATLLAFAPALEATATDDALDVLDRLLDELVHGAARAGKKKRLDTIRDLDAAALVLRDVARVVRDPQCRDSEVRAAVAAAHGEATIDAAIAVVDDLARPPDDHYQREIIDQYPTLRRYLPAVLRTLRFAGIAGTHCLREALAFLAALDGPHPPDIIEAPLAAVPKAWRDRVLHADNHPAYHVDRAAYTCAVMEETHAALRRHDLFVTPSERWGDPRARLLQGPAWEAARPGVCRALNHALDPAVELAVLGHQLDAAYRRTAPTCRPIPMCASSGVAGGTRWC